MLRKIYTKIKSFRSRSRRFEKFNKELKSFRGISNNRFTIDDKDIYPCLYDNTSTTSFDAHYIYHPAWATRIILDINPAKHIDISSTLHFCSMLSAFIPVEFYDYRPAELTLTNLHTGEADLTNLFFENDTIESISCMHTIEHVGLGRYGDIIDPAADIKAVNELKRVTKKGGHIFFVTPVGKPRIQFNAHRIYSYEMIIDLFTGCDLQNFSLVTDENKYIVDADPAMVATQTYACGCFWFKKMAGTNT